jgi:hypothetical protein
MEPMKYCINNKQKLFTRTYMRKTTDGEKELNCAINATKLH